MDKEIDDLLKQIEDAVGPYKLDRLQFAESTIEAMKANASLLRVKVDAEITRLKWFLGMVIAHSTKGQDANGWARRALMGDAAPTGIRLDCHPVTFEDGKFVQHGKPLT